MPKICLNNLRCTDYSLGQDRFYFFGTATNQMIIAKRDMYADDVLNFNSIIKYIKQNRSARHCLGAIDCRRVTDAMLWYLRIKLDLNVQGKTYWRASYYHLPVAVEQCRRYAYARSRVNTNQIVRR